MKNWFKFGILPLMPVLALSAAAQNTPDKDKKGKDDKTQMTRAADPLDASRPVPAATDPNYLIGEQDILDISVWKEPEISRQVPVRPDGKISLPLLNDVQAAGLTPRQLGLLISESLKKYLTDPQVTVIVTAINSQRVYLMGQVSRAGAYPLLPNMTVLQALSSAGGFTTFAKLKKIYVLRTEHGKQVKYPFNYKEVVSGNNSKSDIVLQPGDTIVVP
jgi:polysaccharide export outer membrane protein